jgi:TPR repeat protein
MDISLAGIQGLDLITEGKFEKGFKLVTFAAKRGDPESLYNLGVIYERGFGRKRNLARAVECYEAAAKLNHAPAFYNLAVIHQNAEHPDLEKAESLMKKAAALGLAEAVEVLGVDESEQKSTECKFCDESGWKESPEQIAVRRSSVTRESAQDFWTLARAYQFGLSGLPVDKIFALELFKIAARYLEGARQGYLALYAELNAGSCMTTWTSSLSQRRRHSA